MGDSTLTVLVDGVIYGLQSYGGISRYFTETLMRLGLHWNDIQVVLHLPRRCRANPPRAKWISCIKDPNFKPERIFRDVCKSIGKTMAKMKHPKVFHSTYYTSPYWPRLKTVVTVHDFIHEKFPSLMGSSRDFVIQKKRVIEKADAIVAVSKATRHDILSYTNVEESRVRVVHHGVSEAFFPVSSDEDILAFRQTRGILGPYWIYVGLRGLYKNFGSLLRAFSQVAEETKGHLVAIGGETALESWQVEYLIRNRLENRLHLLHGLDDKELRAAYSGAAAFVFPSLAEGFGIPALEAMACGTPVLLSDIPVFREVAVDAALYFDPHEVEALAQAMLQVLEEPVRQSLIEKGSRRARCFSWDDSAEKLGSIYMSLA